MARVAIIGELPRIQGYGVPGALLFPAKDQAEAVRAWRELPDDIDVAVLTPSAARWLSSEIAGRPWVLPVLLAETPQAQARADGDGLAGRAALPAENTLAESPAGPMGEPTTLAGRGSLAEPGAATDPPVPPPGCGCEGRGTCSCYD